MRALVVTVLLTGCMQDMMNQGAARMAIMAAGNVTGMAGADDDCGFASLTTMLFDLAALERSDDGTWHAAWSIDKCRVGSEEKVLQTDCVGNEMSMRGLATVTGSQRLAVAGLPPQPAGSHAVQMEVTDAHLFELEMTSVPANDPDMAARVTIHEGRVSALLEPVLGESAAAPGTFSVPTPVARIANVRLRDADMTVVAQGSTMRLHVEDSDLTATAGPFGEGKANHIEGVIVIDGADVEVDGDLEEGFEQEKFDARYACVDDLAGPVR